MRVHMVLLGEERSEEEEGWRKVDTDNWMMDGLAAYSVSYQ